MDPDIISKHNKYRINGNCNGNLNGNWSGHLSYWKCKVLLDKPMSVTRRDKIQRASKRLERGRVVGLGSYRVHSCGSTSPSVKAVLAESFVDFHGIDAGNSINVWMDSETGALIILPEDDE